MISRNPIDRVMIVAHLLDPILPIMIIICRNSVIMLQEFDRYLTIRQKCSMLPVRLAGNVHALPKNDDTQQLAQTIPHGQSSCDRK
jgi:hypothetical protein